MASTASSEIRDAFWASVPKFPPGLTLERTGPVVVPQQGPGGTAIYDFVMATAGEHIEVPLVVAYKAPLLAREMGRLKVKLSAIADQRRVRDAAGRKLAPVHHVPAIVTDVATPSVVDACEREGIAIIDRRGTFILHAGSAYIHVEGKGAVDRRWRGRIFSGKASRVVRYILTTVAVEDLVKPRSVHAVAEAVQLSYAYTYGVLTKLESEGFLSRATPHAGFRLTNPVAVLRAWQESGERTARLVEPFNAPNTTLSVLARAAKKLRDTSRTEPLFTLASALDHGEAFTSGLPHGVYLAGDSDRFVEALGLRRITPHNFLILHADPVVETDAGGIWHGARVRSAEEAARSEDARAGGPTIHRVSLPQLVIDFATLPGRGKEQSDFLLGKYADAIPYHGETA